MGQLILHTEKITVEHLGQQGQIESQYSMCDYCNSEQAGADEARFNQLAMNAFKKQELKTVWYLKRCEWWRVCDSLIKMAVVRLFRTTAK